jgi:TonB family protein
MRVAAVMLIGMLGASSAAWVDATEIRLLQGLTRYVAPTFPLELRGVKWGDGHVVMVLTIDSQGQVSDSLPLAANHDAFVQSASKAISGWQFSPADSATVPRRETVEFEFRRQGVVTTLSHAESAREAFISTSVIERKTVQWHELDAEPKRLVSPMPKVSRMALQRLGNRPLMINFIIDAQGRVRLPVISATEDRELAEQVLAVVKEWRYSPPLRQSNPVAVEVTRSLVLKQ